MYCYSLILKSVLPGVFVAPGQDLMTFMNGPTFYRAVTAMFHVHDMPLDWCRSQSQSAQSSRNRFSSYCPVVEKIMRYFRLSLDSNPGQQHDKQMQYYCSYHSGKPILIQVISTCCHPKNQIENTKI